MMSVDPEITFAHLSIVDGAWQEAPDNLTIVEDAGRGTLYVLCEVAGDAEGRDLTTRELIETVRREYAASRGSVVLALTEAVRAANVVLYDANASVPRPARRYAGMTAAVLRECELFIVQGGPGLTVLARDGVLARFPEDSPWYEAQFDPGEANGDHATWSTSGAVPLGIRRDYTPDPFHIALQPGDSVLLSTRSLTHLLNDDDVLNTVAHRHSEEIVEALEDLAGASDLSSISIVYEPIEPLSSQVVLDSVAASLPPELPIETAAEEEPGPNPPAEARAEGGLAERLASLLAAFSRKREDMDFSRLGAMGGHITSVFHRGIAFLVLASSRTFLVDETRDRPRGKGALDDRRQRLWRLAALVLPILLIAVGGAAWISYRSDVTRLHAAQINQLTIEANAALEAGKKSARGGDKAAARAAFEKAQSLTQQMQAINPSHAGVRKISFEVQDQLDGLNGIGVLSAIAKFGALGSAANRPRIILRWPDIFVFDREAQRVYRYIANDSSSNAAPLSTDAAILKTGDKVGERTVVELIDIAWVETGRLVALDRSGAFLQYDPAKPNWTMRPASDAAQWARATMAISYAGNLYVLDPSRNQIWKYAASDNAWSPGAAYLAAGVNVDLTSAVDMAIDGDVWILRADSSLWRLAAGRLADFTLRDLDKPLGKPTAVVTSQSMVGLYIVDAGNQRIVQFDKANGRYVRQLRPGSENRETFAALKMVAIDEANRKVVFVSGNQLYLGTLPQ